MCMSVAFLGMRQAYQRLYFDMQSEASSRALTSTIVLANFAVAIFVLFPLLTLASIAGRQFGADHLTVSSSAALALWIAFEATYMIGLSHMQVRMRSRQFVIAQSSRLLLLISINFVLLKIFNLGLNGALIGNLSASVLSGLLTAIVLLRSAGLQVSIKYFKEVVAFGLPYIPTVFFVYVIGNADRLALIHFGAVASLGLLALAGKIGELALMIFSGPVDNVWSPYALSVFTETSGPKKIGTLYTKFVAMYVFMALGVSLSAPIRRLVIGKGRLWVCRDVGADHRARLGVQRIDDAIRYWDFDIQENMDEALGQWGRFRDCRRSSICFDPSVRGDRCGRGYRFVLYGSLSDHKDNQSACLPNGGLDPAIF